MFEVSDGGADWAEVGRLGEGCEGFADTGCDLLGAKFGSTVHDDLSGANTGTDGLGEFRDEVVAYKIDDCEIAGQGMVWAERHFQVRDFGTEAGDSISRPFREGFEKIVGLKVCR